MRRFYNKETRNEEGVYYRRGDWGVDRPDDWFKPTFTDIAPPEDAFEGISCDWDENLQEWILNVAEKEKKDALAYLASTDKDIARVAEDLISVLIAKNVIAESDFVEQTNEKLLNRKNARKNLS